MIDKTVKMIKEALKDKNYCKVEKCGDMHINVSRELEQIVITFRNQNYPLINVNRVSIYQLEHTSNIPEWVECTFEKVAGFRPFDILDKEIKTSKQSFKKELDRLSFLFEDSFINMNNELILVPKLNIYLNLNVGIRDSFSLKCRFIESMSRNTIRGSEYYKKYFLKRVNEFLGTDFIRKDFEDWIYRFLGNGVDKELTKKFVRSGYDLEVIKSSYIKPIKRFKYIKWHNNYKELEINKTYEGEEYSDEWVSVDGILYRKECFERI